MVLTHKTVEGPNGRVQFSTSRVVLGPAETAALLLWLKERNDEVD